MRTKTKILIATTAGLAIAAAAATVSVATGSDDRPLEGTALDRTTSAALAYTGQGTVIETEAGDDGATYEAEVRLDDGSVVEVQLDERFEAIGSTPDDDSGEASDD
jgi:hypothetical protein